MTGDDDPRFVKFVDSLVLAGIVGGATSLGDLVESLPGVYPTTVRASVARLYGAGCIEEHTHRRFLTLRGSVDPSQHLPIVNSDHEILLPDPHPLDYDWRFDTSTVDLLLQRCVWPVDQTIALLGAPSILRAVLEGCRGGNFVLLERSPSTVDALSAVAPEGRVLQRDVARDLLPRLQAATVIADPPWYPSHTRAFLWAAAHVSKPGASVLFSLPGLGTRPGIEDGRRRDFEWARRHGLELDHIEPGVIRYESPPFERRALIAAGLGTVSLTWRRADLAVFRRTESAIGERPRSPADDKWVEVCIGDARIRFKEDAGSHRLDPRLIPLVDGDVLPTVSRRDPIRSRVAVWTASNRVFGCRSPQVLRKLASATAAGHVPIEMVQAQIGRSLSVNEARLVKDALRQLDRLLSIECDVPHIAPRIV